MKLLIITQVIDTEHPILGFFHRWVEEFAKHCEHVHVIALQVGVHNLPPNVTVHSLGKERGVGKLRYLFTFYRLIWQLRHEYDSVFVHMNQIYVILGAPIWRILRKRIGLWYAHGAVSYSLKIATFLADSLLTSTNMGLRIRSEKRVLVGQGIDTTIFVPKSTCADFALITVGRITKAKNLHTLIRILASVRKIRSDVTLTFVGNIGNSDDQEYLNVLQAEAIQLGVDNSIIWHGGVKQTELPALLARAQVFVTTAQNGSLDKAILEAMAVGLPVVSLASGSITLPLGVDQCTSSEDCVERILYYLHTGIEILPQYTDYVRTQHSLAQLIPKILNHF